MQGFKTAERTNVVVNANDKFSSGVIALEVGGIEESVSVSGRVSELQAESGERSFTLESESLKNIAANGRMMFNYALLVPGALSQDANAGNEIGQVSSFTVNGQRPNSNNMTIDGVSNIDTGDNGGNMATTNIEAVGEFKILTNAYQAEYGRAVGGQVQVVTKSGTQPSTARATGSAAAAPGTRTPGRIIARPRRRRSATEPRSPGRRPPRRLRLHDRRPDLHPGLFNTEKKKLFFFWPRSSRSARTLPPLRRRVCRPRSSAPATSRRASTPAATPSSSATTRSTCPATPPTSAAASRRNVTIPANRIYAPGLATLNIFPDAEHQPAAA